MVAEPDAFTATWQQVRAGLDQELQATHRVWLAQSRPVTLHGNTAIVAVRDDFTRTQLETKLRPRLEDALSTALGQSVRLAVTVEPSLTLDDTDTDTDADADIGDYDTGEHEIAVSAGASGQTYSVNGPVPIPDHDERSSPGLSIGATGTDAFTLSSAPPGQPVRTDAEPARLNPKYTFDTFVIGSSQPVRARGRGRRRRGAGQGVQPAVHLRRVRARQDPPAARDRALRAAACTPAPG